jgi:hypothetical protein
LTSRGKAAAQPGKADRRFPGVSTAEQAPFRSRPENARDANDGIAAEARRQRFVSRIPTLCECSNPACSAVFVIRADAYDQARADPGTFLTAPGHWLEGGQLYAREDEYWVQHRRRSAS